MIIIKLLKVQIENIRKGITHKCWITVHKIWQRYSLTFYFKAWRSLTGEFCTRKEKNVEKIQNDELNWNSSCSSFTHKWSAQLRPMVLIFFNNFLWEEKIKRQMVPRSGRPIFSAGNGNDYTQMDTHYIYFLERLCF